MPRYSITDSAKADIREIISYIRRDSKQAAKKVRADLAAEMKRLAQFPGIGHHRDDSPDPSLRFWSVHSFLIVYRPDVTPVRVVRVIRGTRDVGSVLRRP